MAKHLLRQGQTQGMEHNRPNNGVEADNFLAHQMHICRPVLVKQVLILTAVAQCRDVVGQRIQPHIYRVLGVKVHRNAPLDGGTADAQVIQAGLEEIIDHFVGTAGRLNELRMIVDILNQPILIFVQLKEIAFFPRLFHRPSTVRAFSVLELQLRPERLAGGAVPAFVLPLINISLIVQLLENLLHALHMALIRGADEIIIADVHQLPQILNAGHDVVHISLGSHALILRLALNLLAVLIRTRQEIRIIAGHPLEASHGVSCRGTVCMADVQVITGVIDGRGDVKGLLLTAMFTHDICLLLACKKSAPSVVPRGGLNPRCHPDLSLFLRITARPVAAYFPSASKLRSHVPKHSAAAFHLLQLSWRILSGTHSFIACTWHYTLIRRRLSRFWKLVSASKTVAAIHSHGRYLLVR